MMNANQQLLSWLLPIGALLAAMLLVGFARRRILVSAVIVAVVATLAASLLDPHPGIYIELGNTIVAFLFALGGGALGSRFQRRTVR
ncbi:MAG TPA: hypothetical protein VFK19_11565 [Sphingomicrobium sp.]|nr:hypothetical protein [Sphingomicrobium sp.]